MTTKRMRGSSAAGRPVTPAPETLSPSAVVIASEAPSPAPTALAIPLSSRAVFWRPRYPGATRSLVHLPFLFWLVETLRPVRIAQLGLEDPGAYLGLCQAVDKSGLEAICMGVEADPAQPAMTGKTAAQHAALYGDFSFIAPDDLGQANRHMRSGGIDLLVIDMALTPEAITQLQTQWLPNLSERAVLVIHDPDTRLADPAARAFLEELRRARPEIAFPQASPGMQVLLIGGQQTDRLQRLADLEIGMPGHLAAYQVFARLGQGLVAEQRAGSGAAALEREVTARKALAAQVKTLEAELGQERGAKAAALAGEASQLSQLATLQRQLFEERKAHEAAAPQLEALRVEREALQARLEAMEADLARERGLAAALAGEKAGLDAELTGLRAITAATETALQEASERRAGLMLQLAEAETAAAGQAQARGAAEAALREALQVAQAQRQTLEAELSAAREARAAEAAQSADQISALRAELAQSEAARQEGAGQLAELQQRLAELTARTARQDEALSAGAAAAVGLERDLAAQRQAQDAERARQAELAAELAAERAAEAARLADAEAAAAASAARLAQTQAEAAAAVARLSEVEAALAEAEAAGRDDGEAQQAALRQAEAERQEAESRNERLTEEIARLREQLRQSRERRLAVWESQERLRSEHEALLARDVPHIRSVEK